MGWFLCNLNEKQTFDHKNRIEFTCAKKKIKTKVPKMGNNLAYFLSLRICWVKVIVDSLNVDC